MSFMNMAKQLKDMQGEMKKARAALSAISVTGKSGGNAVVVEMNGAMDIKNVTIDPKAIAKKDEKYLEKMVTEAFADALRRVQKVASSQLGSIIGMAGKNPFGG
jgi:nucleoid-associated protein EbfC